MAMAGDACTGACKMRQTVCYGKAIVKSRSEEYLDTGRTNKSRTLENGPWFNTVIKLSSSAIYADWEIQQVMQDHWFGDVPRNQKLEHKSKA
jgi:hypothetical protein